MTDPQDQSPWANPDKPHGAYEVQAVGDLGPPMPPAPELAPPQAGYQVHPVNNMGFPMPPLAPLAPQELPVQRPATITAAMWIWIAGAVLSVAVFPVLFLTNTEFFLDQGPESDRAAGEFGVRALALIFGFLMLVAAAPYVAFAIVLRNGQNWARVLLTVLGAIGFLSTFAIMFFALAAQVWQPGTAICIVVLGLTVAAVVLQFLPASNRYVR
ncbi:hypothetical protein UK23_02415 [Lentzea aerocolonigenes]|uniref:Uncharacterized protein n=1 Tax=Lentzea aerocolonigenes TaxID=68170 RepID=A0A0F0HD96_LENAE|nr:hypothetical protein [Lentzea aerocolonigenes]KJK52836.1 hypothetical protein UK23_02415 [Lentzea aerocolonigenes]